MTAAPSHLLLRAFCDELARCGLRHACTSPGSRSSPLVLALTRESRICCWSHIDERCAGFFALGAAKAGGLPVALTCTSGTAAANFAPAVIEAWQARVPLIVLTADRPPELREVGAGQAIDQLKLYGSAAKWFFEVGLDDATPSALRWIRQLACRAYWTALSGRPGPVHLNFPLREPLVPHASLGAGPVPGRAGGGPWLAADPALPGPALPARTLPARGVVVAGRRERGRRQDPHPAAELAERLGYPLLADPLSGARASRVAIATYDLLLREPGFSGRMRPEVVLRFGDLPTSKPLRQWLAGLQDAQQVVFDPEQAWQDPNAVLSEVVAGDPSAWESPTSEPAWLSSWQDADRTVGEVIEQQLGEELSEPQVARRLAGGLPDRATLFVASSMPIRDIELYAPAGPPAGERPPLLSNRGANGIDGTVSSAYGAAAAGSGPVVLLIGDVALAHDIGGLLAGRRLGIPLTIVVLNNDGGGIFHFLPAASESDAFEEHIATPHGLDFSHAAALYGCSFERVDTVAALEATVRESIEADGTQIIEVQTNREQNLALHQRVAAAALQALAADWR